MNLRARATALVLAGLLPASLMSCTKESAIAVDDPCASFGCANGQDASPGTGSSGGGGGADGSSGAGGDGTAAGADTGDATAGRDAGDAEAQAPLALYTLVVDTPTSGATVSGIVTVTGRSNGLLNIEVWDATHQHPPLARTTPASDGSFSTTVDTTGLATGSTTWTVYGWDVPAGATPTNTANVPLPLTIGTPAGDAGGVGAETVGVGDVAAPALGPAPSEASTIGGAGFVLVKNWDFGTSGTIRGTTDLVSEFNFHDQFGTIANGTNYGAVIVAPTSATAITQSGLGLAGNMQPVEDPANPTREWTATSMLAHVRPLSTSQSTVSATAHNAGNGSIVAKWTLANGGTLLGKDILWETRVRMPTPLAAYWFALWTSGNKWNGGAEMDVLESFGSSNVYPPPTAFHVNSVGGTDSIDYSSWPTGLTTAGIPTSDRDLTAYHVWTWLYRADDSYTVYFDGHVAQTGTLHWTLGGTSTGEVIDMDFLFDLGWGHTQVSSVNISLPASSFPLTYEIDYSRVYLR